MISSYDQVKSFTIDVVNL